jgi:hypothetical protein
MFVADVAGRSLGYELAVLGGGGTSIIDPGPQTTSPILGINGHCSRLIRGCRPCHQTANVSIKRVRRNAGVVPRPVAPLKLARFPIGSRAAKLLILIAPAL